MHQFRAAQPALLYLSPACILSVTFTALLRGELQAFWQYTDEDEGSKTKKKADADLKSESKSVEREKVNGHDTSVAKTTSSDAHTKGSVRLR